MSVNPVRRLELHELRRWHVRVGLSRADLLLLMPAQLVLVAEWQMAGRADVGAEAVADAQMAVVLVSVVRNVVALRTGEVVLSRVRSRRLHDVAVRRRLRRATSPLPRQVAVADDRPGSDVIAVLARGLFEGIGPFLLGEYLSPVS